MTWLLVGGAVVVGFIVRPTFHWLLNCIDESVCVSLGYRAPPSLYMRGWEDALPKPGLNEKRLARLVGLD